MVPVASFACKNDKLNPLYTEKPFEYEIRGILANSEAPDEMALFR